MRNSTGQAKNMEKTKKVLFSGVIILALFSAGLFLTQKYSLAIGSFKVALADEEDEVDEPKEADEPKEVKERVEQKEKVEKKEAEEKKEKVEKKEIKETKEADESAEKTETKETIKNSDGTTTVIVKKIEGNKVEIKTITYSRFGKVISQKEEKEEDDGKKENQETLYDNLGNKIGERKTKIGKSGSEVELEIKVTAGGEELSKMKVKRKDGNFINLEIEKSGTDKSKVKYNSEEELEIESEEGEEYAIKIKAKSGVFKISQKGLNVNSNFPLRIDEETGRIIVTTSKGDVELKNTPAIILAKAQANDGIDEIETAELNSEGELKYVIEGKKTERLLGIFKLKIPVKAGYSVETGENLLLETQSFFSRFLDAISF